MAWGPSVPQQHQEKEWKRNSLWKRNSWASSHQLYGGIPVLQSNSPDDSRDQVISNAGLPLSTGRKWTPSDAVQQAIWIGTQRHHGTCLAGKRRLWIGGQQTNLAQSHKHRVEGNGGWGGAPKRRSRQEVQRPVSLKSDIGLRFRFNI